MVVFGVKPLVGHIGHKWIATSGPADEIVPWYKCILPPETSDLFGQRRLLRPVPSDVPGRHVRLDLPMIGMDGSGISWLIDEHGNEVPDARVVADAYKRNLDTLPPPKRFYLGDLPPVISKHVPADVDSDGGD